MAKLDASPDADAMVSEIKIAASPERVFQALTDPEQVVKWWGGQGAEQSFRCTHFQSVLRAGGKWQSIGVDGQGGRFEASGEYLEVDRPRRLAYSWVASWTGDAKTTVCWELEPDGEGTLLRIRHSGLSAHPEVARSYRGWPRMLGWIQAFLERGQNVADR